MKEDGAQCYTNYSAASLHIMIYRDHLIRTTFGAYAFEENIYTFLRKIWGQFEKYYGCISYKPYLVNVANGFVFEN